MKIPNRQKVGFILIVVGILDGRLDAVGLAQVTFMDNGDGWEREQEFLNFRRVFIEAGLPLGINKAFYAMPIEAHASGVR